MLVILKYWILKYILQNYSGKYRKVFLGKKIIYIDEWNKTEDL